VLETLKNMFKVPEIRKRFLFTLLILVIYRFGAQIPAPGIDPAKLQQYFGSSPNDFFGMFDMFAGGAFMKASIFALGIMPYISSSIVVQMMGSVIPSLHKLQKEGAEGRKKITQITRYGALFFAAFQSISVAIFLKTIQTATGESVVLEFLSGWQFMIITVIGLTTGCILVMWLGEQITSKGIGNGMSLLILFGIVVRIPELVFVEYQYLVQGTHTLFREALIAGVIIAMTAFIVYIYQAVRKIPIQTPKKTIGSRVAQGQSTVLPLKINSAGVIPIIFASSLMMLPSMFMGIFQNSEVMSRIGRIFVPGGFAYGAMFAMLIIVFTYFYTSVIFNPVDISENLKKIRRIYSGRKAG